MRLRKNADCVVMAVVARKGGVGKTFTAINTAINAAMGGPDGKLPKLNVLVIDVDSQQNSSYFFLKKLGAKMLGDRVILPTNPDCEENGIYNISDIFAGNEFLEYPTEYNNIHIIPSDGNIDDFRKTSEAAKHSTDDDITKVAVAQFQKLIDFMKDDYDLIVIDTPPSKTHASQGAIAAATHCMIVAGPDSYNSEVAVPGIISDINSNNERYKTEETASRISGILFNKISSSRPTKHEAQHIMKIKEDFPQYFNPKLYFCNYVAFNTEIPQEPDNFDWQTNEQAKRQMSNYYSHVSESVLDKIYGEKNA